MLEPVCRAARAIRLPLRATALGAALVVALGRIASPQSSVPENPQLLLAEAGVREKANDWPAAASIWERLVTLNPTMPDYWNRLGEASRKAAQYPLAIKAFRRALELGASYPGPAAYEIAACYALAGDKENAFLWARKAMDLGLRSRALLTDDEQFASLRSDPSFQSLAMVADVHSMTRVEGWRHDLAFLAAELKRRHYQPFRRISREDFDAAVRRLHDAIPGLRDEEIEVALMRIAASIGDAHTYLRPRPTLGTDAKGLPIQMFFFKEGLYVIRAAPEHQQLVGLRLARIGQHTPQELLNRLDPIISKDNEMTPLMIGPDLMAYPRLLFGLRLLPDPDKAVLTLEDDSGVSRQVTLHAQPLDSAKAWPGVRAGSGPAMPLYLKHLETNYWFEYVAASKLLFFQYNAVREGREPLRTFLDRLFRFADEHEVDRLVIDLRWNTGGTRLLNQQLIHRLIRSDKLNRPGKLFVVIGRHTFSAGMMLATGIEQNTHAVFVGEPTGSSPNFVGQDATLRLPFSGMTGSLSDLYWQISAATDFRVWIAPFLYTPPSHALFQADRDPALEAILAYKPPARPTP